jgi:hypothetical protein
MRLGLVLYRIGGLGLLLTAGVLMEEPLFSSVRQSTSAWASLSILYGFVVLAGLILLGLKPKEFGQASNSSYVCHGLALIAVLWLVLWCFVWLALMSNLGDKAEMFIKHTAYLHLFGVGFSMAGYATGWMASHQGERSARFLMTVGWAASYMAWFNLYLQPTLQWLWAPAIGGLLAAAGAYLISRQFKPAVEAPR